jgi:hypothetical protein
MSLTPDPSTQPETPAIPKVPKTLDIKPQHKFVANGSIIQCKQDVYPTTEKYLGSDNLDGWNGMGGETPFFCTGSDMLILEQAQFYQNSKANVRIKVLCNERVGWISICEISRAKEWDWMIPMKQSKRVREEFDKLFDIKVEN